MIVLDTHVWLWYLNDPQRLSKTAADAVNHTMTENGIYVSSISVWEVALLVHKGRLVFTMELSDWIAHSEALSFVNFVAVDNTIAMKAVNLPESLHSDPADRIIISTARHLGVKLVTKDQRIRDYPYVETVW